MTKQSTKTVKKPVQKRVRRTKAQIEAEKKATIKKPIEQIEQTSAPIEPENIPTLETNSSTETNQINTTPVEPIEDQTVNIGDFVSQIPTKEVPQTATQDTQSDQGEQIHIEGEPIEGDEPKQRKKRKAKTDEQDQFLGQLAVMGLEFLNDKLCNKIDKYNTDPEKYKFHEGARQIMANKLSETDISKVFDEMNPLTAFAIVAIGCTAINVGRAFFDKEPQPIAEPVKQKTDGSTKK